MQTLSSDQIEYLKNCGYIRPRISFPDSVEITNLLTNGDFSDGETGWDLLRCANPATGNGYLSFTRESGTNAIIGNDIHSDYWKNEHRYYIKIAFNNDASQQTQIQEFDYGVYVNGITMLNTEIPSGSNTVSTIYAAKRNGCRLSVRSYIANSTNVTRIGYVSCIDLTDLEAALGREVTVAEIEKWLSRFEDSWFDGTAPYMFIKESDILENSLVLDRNSVSGADIEVGNTESSELSFILDNYDRKFDSYVFEGSTIILDVYIYDAWVRAGIFVIDEQPQKTDTIRIVALDYMSRFSVPYSTALTGEKTLLEIIQDVCTYRSITLETTSFLNDDYLGLVPTGANVTCRQVLSWVCQLSGTNAYIDQNGHLVLGWYGEQQSSDIGLIADDRFDFVYGHESLQISGIVYSSVDGETLIAGNRSYAIHIEDNQILQSANAETVLTAVYDKISVLSWVPFEAKTKSFLHWWPMDILKITPPVGDAFYSILTNSKWTLNNSGKIQGKGTTKQRKGYSRNVGFTTGQKAILNQVLEMTKTEIISDTQQATLSLNSLISNAIGFYQTHVENEDGSSILYIHDSETIAASTNIYILTESGFAWTDAGWPTYPSGTPEGGWKYGVDASGSMILRILYVVGINADWINSGRVSADFIEVKQKNGNLLVNSPLSIVAGNASSFTNALAIIGEDCEIKHTIQGWCMAADYPNGYLGTGSYFTDYGWFHSFKTPMSFTFDPAELVSAPISCEVGQTHVLSYYGLFDQFNDLYTDSYGIMLGLEFDTGAYKYYEPFNVFRTPIISGDTEWATDSSVEPTEPPFYIHAYDAEDEFYLYRVEGLQPTRYSVKFTLPSYAFVKSGTEHKFTGNVCIYLKDRRTSSMSITLVSKIQFEKNSYLTGYAPKEGEISPTGVTFSSNGIIVREGSTLTIPEPTLDYHAASKQYVDDNVPPAVSDYIDETVPPAVSNYIISRGQNLVTNGAGLLGNNYNFSNFVFSGADAYSSAGSFVASTYTFDKRIDELIPVDVDLSYRMSYYIKANPYVGAKAYGYVSSFDIDGLVIGSQNVMYIANTLTTLADDLEPGDTVVKLTSAANYINSAGSQTYRRSLIFWNYQNSYGYTYPENTYSRNVFQNLWADGSVNYTTNEITLSAPWAGDTIPSGTKVSNGSAGGTYQYIAGSNFVIPSSWTKYSGVISGVNYSGTDIATMFRPGTAFIRLGWLLNRDVVGSTSWLANVFFGVDNNIRDTSTKVGTVTGVSSSAWTTVTFPTAFPTGSTVKVFVSIASEAGGVIAAKVRNESATGFQVTIGGSGISGISVNWQAILV